MRVQKSFLKRRTSYGGATHLHQSGKVKALQPAGPIYQQGPGSGVPFWACCFNNSWNVFFFFIFCAFILLCSFLFLDPAQHNAIHLPQHGSSLSDAYKFAGPMRAQWALSHAGVTVATSHLNFTLRCLNAEQQMCLLAICSGVCHNGGCAAASASCGIQAGRRYKGRCTEVLTLQLHRAVQWILLLGWHWDRWVWVNVEGAGLVALMGLYSSFTTVTMDLRAHSERSKCRKDQMI